MNCQHRTLVAQSNALGFIPGTKFRLILTLFKLLPFLVFCVQMPLCKKKAAEEEEEEEEEGRVWDGIAMLYDNIVLNVYRAVCQQELLS